MKLDSKLEKEYLELIEQYPFNQITYSINTLETNKGIIWYPGNGKMISIDASNLGYRGKKSPMYQGVYLWQKDAYLLNNHPDFLEQEMQTIIKYAERCVRIIELCNEELFQLMEGK